MQANISADSELLRDKKSRPKSLDFVWKWTFGRSSIIWSTKSKIIEFVQASLFPTQNSHSNGVGSLSVKNIHLS